MLSKLSLKRLFTLIFCCVLISLIMMTLAIPQYLNPKTPSSKPLQSPNQINQQLSGKIQQQLDYLTQVMQISNLAQSIYSTNNEDSIAKFQALSQVFKYQFNAHFVQFSIKYQNQLWSDNNHNPTLTTKIQQTFNQLSNSSPTLKAQLKLIFDQLVFIAPITKQVSLKENNTQTSEQAAGFIALVVQPGWLIQGTGFYLTDKQQDIIAAPDLTEPKTPDFSQPINFSPNLAHFTKNTDWQLVAALVDKTTYADKLMNISVFICTLMLCLIVLLLSRIIWLHFNAINQLTHGVFNLNNHNKQSQFNLAAYPGEFHKLVKAFKLLTKRLIRKNALIHTQKQQLNRALNIAKIGTFELHCDTLKLYCSETLFDIIELPQKPTHSDLFTSLPEPYAPLISEALDKLIHPASTNKTEFFNCRIKTDQKNEQHLHIRLEKLKIDGYSIILGCINDISEIKNTEHHLAHSLERLAYAQEATNDGIWDWDIVNNQVYISARWRQMLGYQANELDSNLETLQALIHPADAAKIQTLIAELLAGNRSGFDEEFRMQHKSGEYIWILSRAKVFASDKDNKPLRMIGSNTDITQSKLTQHKLILLNDELEQRVEHRTKQLELSNQALTEAKDKAEQANKIKSEFLANMSHEIRTPLNAIIGLTNIMKKSQLDAEQNQRLNHISSASDNLLSIINDILDFSKIEAGKLTIERIQFNLSQVITKISQLFAHKAHQKGIEFIVNVEPNVPFSLIGDPNRLNQILLNLISNAIKFTEQGKIELLVKLKTCNDLNVRIEFSVTDSGIGLTDEQQTQLFTSFTQADSSTSRKYGGTGLGLTICKQLCQLMQGEISVSSQINQGSTFSFELLFGLNNILQPIYQPEQLIYTDYPVLLIEPNAQLSQQVTLNLSTFGYTCLSYQTINQALSNLTGQIEFKLVIVDYQSIADQAGLFQQLTLASACKQAYFVIQHNSIEPQDLPQISHGEYLNKPLHIWDLYRLISKPEQNAENKDNPNLDNQMSKQTPSQANLDILVVEDNEINQEVAKALLNHHGFNVTLANNGKQALEVLNKHKFALILMDIQMPEMDGYQATREIRKIEHHKNLPIIAMTANAMAEDKEQCIEHGMNDHIAKPIDESALLATISNWLGQSFSAQPSNTNPKQQSEQTATAMPNQAVDNSLISSAPYTNLSYALTQLSGSHDLMQKMLKKFIEGHQNSAHKISSFIELQQNHSAQQLIHSVKGVAGNLGLQKLYLVCKHFENAFTQNTQARQNESIKYWMSQYSDVLDETIKQLNQQITTPANEESIEHQPINFDEVLSQLYGLNQKLQQDEFITQTDIQPIQGLAHLTDIKDTYQTLIHEFEIFDNEAASTSLMKLIEYCRQQLQTTD